MSPSGLVGEEGDVSLLSMIIPSSEPLNERPLLISENVPETSGIFIGVLMCNTYKTTLRQNEKGYSTKKEIQIQHVH